MKNFTSLNSARMRKGKTGFSLIELLAVLVIIALIGSFGFPAYQKMIAKAESLSCANNLRQIGAAVQLAVQDNNGYYPNIEPDPENPIYGPEDNAQTLANVLEPYNVSGNVLKCSADVKAGNYFKQKGTSYMWRPLVDGEDAASPTIIFRRGVIVHPQPSRIRLVTDYDSVHHGRSNAVFADGHVKVY